MKYGIYFLLLSVVMMITAVQHGSWYYALAYPAMSFAIVSIGYLGLGPRVFGKRSDGKRNLLATVLLLPYLIFTLVTWHLIRLLSRESAVDQVDPDLYLSRRLLSTEIPESVKSVVDLTCEFTDPKFDRGNYICFPMLDASCPTAEELNEMVQTVLALPKPVLIHCAQGHGRTGLVASAVLLASGKVASPRAALAMVKAARPGVELNSAQRNALDSLSKQN